MNRKIQSLTALLESTMLKHQAELNEAKSKLQAEWNKVFDDAKVLHEDFARLENSSEYGSDEGGYYLWCPMKFPIPKDDYAREALESYVSEHGYSIDAENAALKNYDGECIVISDETGDVYLSDGTGWSKEIIKADEYTTENDEHDFDKRNELIEAWMEKSGYYPSVLLEARYGEVRPVNTQKKK